MPAPPALLRTAAATGAVVFALVTAAPAVAHDNPATDEHAATGHAATGHAATMDHATMDHATTDHATSSPSSAPTSAAHDHSTMSPSTGPTPAAHDHDHEHGTDPAPVQDGPSDGSRALVLGGFAVANIVVVAGAALTRVASPPRHLPRNRRP